MQNQLQKFFDTNRILTLDALRGIVIIVMALDHANAFIAKSKLQPELWADMFPNYQSQPNILFMTRFVSHLAAPGFFFLMGIGMTLFTSSRRIIGWSDQKIGLHFVVRGTLLIFFQFALENLAWSLQSPVGLYFGVLYGLGAAMIFGLLLLFMPQGFLLFTSAVLIIGTTLILPDQRTGFIPYPLALRLILLPGYTGQVLVLYPLIPWLGVTGLGMAFGRLFEKNTASAYRTAFWTSIVSLILFLTLRALGGFGNIRPPSGTGWINFLNVVKYPPSVTFLLLTLGGLLLILVILSKTRNRYLWPLAVYGRVPLFFYLSHLFLYGFMGILVAGENGIGIMPMLPYWILGLLLLWPFCLLFGLFKQSRPGNSLWHYF